MTKEIIETTAEHVAAELARRGIRPQERVIVTIDPDKDLLTRGREESRARVTAAGLSDDEIDRMIKEAINEVRASPG